MNSWIRKPLILVLAGVLILLNIDIGLRVFSRLLSETHVPAQDTGALSLFLPGLSNQLRPNLTATVSAAGGLPAFAVTTNAYGMRMPDVHVDKTPGVTRIAVMGDSIAFGWGVAVEQTFPMQLAEILKQDGGKFEVLNFASPGFTSFHGRMQYEEVVQAFRPDVLVLAFGLYDFYESRVAEKDFFALTQKYQSLLSDKGLLPLLDPYSTVIHSMNEKRKAQAQRQWDEELHRLKQNPNWSPRVGETEFEANITSIVQSQKSQGGKSILLHTNLQHFADEPSLERLAVSLEIPLLDLRDFLDRLGGVDERRRIVELDLQATKFEQIDTPGPSRCLLRVYVPSSRIATPIYVVGNHPQLGDNRPHIMSLYDDRTHGDEKSGDNVWSLALDLSPMQPFFYGFTESGPAGEWGTPGTEMENTRKNQTFYYRFKPADLEEPYQWTSPVHIFGQPPYSHLTFPGEIPYPNELGHKAIARRLTYAIKEALNPHFSLAQTQ